MISTLVNDVYKEKEIMPDFLKAALQAIPSASSSPLSLIAFVCVIVAWVFISFRVARIGLVLKNLKDFPENQRADLVRAEMGAVIPPDLKSDPEPYLRLREQFYYFVGFTLICAVLVVVFVTAALTHSGNLLLFFLGFALVCLILALFFGRNALRKNSELSPAAITLYNEHNAKSSSKQSRHRADSSQSASGLEITDIETQDDPEKHSLVYWQIRYGVGQIYQDYDLRYSYTHINGKIWIKPEMPYLSRLSSGGPISGPFLPPQVPFGGHFPKLSVKLVNNGKKTIALSEAIVKIISSKVNIEPVLLFQDDRRTGRLHIFNEGWGQVLNPVITFRIKEIHVYNPERLIRGDGQEHTIKAESFLEEIYIPIVDYVPNIPEFSKFPMREEGGLLQSHMTIEGEIHYSTETHENRNIKFNFDVHIGGFGGAGLPPTGEYDLRLKAGETGTQHLSIDQEIKSGDADHFLIRVGSDKSAQFTLSFSFRTVEELEILGSEEVMLDIFVPRKVYPFV